MPHPQSADRRRSFGLELGLKPSAFTSPMYKKFLDTISRGDAEARAEIKATLADLGLVPVQGAGLVARENGLFAAGAEFWGRNDTVSTLVAHPSRLTNESVVKLKGLSTIAGVDVHIDDRPGYGGHGSHHIRISPTGLKVPGQGQESPFYKAY